MTQWNTWPRRLVLRPECIARPLYWNRIKLFKMERIDSVLHDSVKCVVCGKSEQVMKRCSRCQETFYWYFTICVIILDLNVLFVLIIANSSSIHSHNDNLWFRDCDWQCQGIQFEFVYTQACWIICYVPTFTQDGMLFTWIYTFCLKGNKTILVFMSMTMV